METNPQTELRQPLLAIDIGGTWLRAAVFSPGMGPRKQTCTLAAQGAEAVLKRLRRLIGPMVDQLDAPLAGIAIASAGQVDPDAGIVVDATANLPGFRGLDLRRHLEHWNLTGETKTPILVENDVNAALAAEALANSDTANMVVMALGTGVGGALMIDRQLVRGRHFFAGELGHMILHPHGRSCNCGQEGCLEQYVSGPGLLQTGRQYHGPLETPDTLWQAVGEPWAEATLDHFAADLSLALTSVVNLLDPDLVVLAGGLSTTHRWWHHRLLKSLAATSRKPVPLAYAQFGDDSALVGAVVLHRQRYLTI